MANEHLYLAGEGALWVQINGPNTRPVYLGCHEVGDVDESEGDITLIRCPDPRRQNAFVTRGSFQGAPSPITFSVTTGIAEDLDELERVKCNFTMFVHKAQAGVRNRFTNFQRSFIFYESRVTSRGLSALLARSEDNNGQSEMSFDISSESLLRVIEPTLNRQSSGVTEAESINDIAFCNEQVCRTSDDPAMDACEVGYAVADAGSTATAAVLRTEDGGSNWTQTAADPFAADEHISAVSCFELDNQTTRVVVARGTTDAGNPPEIAYSDDEGATWTTVDVGSDTGEFVPTAHSMFALDSQNMWLGTDGGHTFYSADAGVSWTLVDDQGIHSAAWNAISFVDEDTGWIGGAANAIARTTDGGTTWTSVTGPSGKGADAVLAIAALDQNRAWVGYDDGELWYTEDAGSNWTQRSFTGTGTGEVRDIKFFNDTLGFMLKNDASPVGSVLWTINGGYTWQSLDSETNSGYNAMVICDVWNFFVAGEANGGTGYIAKATV